MARFIVTSLVLSIIATLVLNLVSWRAGRRQPPPQHWRDPPFEPADAPFGTEPFGRSSRVRVFAPWKAMLLGSLVLTILLNVLLALR